MSSLFFKFQNFLQSERATLSKCAKKSRHNEVSLTPEPSFLAEWAAEPFDPDFRMELQYSPVPVYVAVQMYYLLLVVTTSKILKNKIK